MPICKECAKKKDMPDRVWGRMTVEGFRQYIVFHQENQPLRDRFEMTFSWRDIINMDMRKRLFRLNDRPEALVMEASCIRSFRILEENNVLFESSPGGLKCYETDVPARVRAAEPAIAQFNIRLEQFRQMERMRGAGRREGNDGNHPYVSEPLFDYPIFHKGFGLELTLEHPYWGGTHSWYKSGPVFDDTYPRTDDFLRKFDKEMKRLHELAVNLMNLLGLNAAEIWGSSRAPAWGGGSAQTPPTADPAAEIQKYKALLDSGAITEEEFAAKKRQLLNI